MADLTAAIKRVPRWAWYTSAGVAIGAIVLFTIRNRATEEVPDESSTGEPTGVPDSYGPSPVPGIVVPDINIPGNTAGENGYLDIHNLYLEAMRDIMDSFTNPGPAAAVAPVLPEAVMVTGGGAPAENRSGVVTVPVVAPAPKPPCCLYSGHALSWWQNPTHNKRNGKWRWPGSGFVHSRSFAGHTGCDGGGAAPWGGKREC